MNGARENVIVNPNGKVPILVKGGRRAPHATSG
jgi:hypothetical protein